MRVLVGLVVLSLVTAACLPLVPDYSTKVSPTTGAPRFAPESTAEIVRPDNPEHAKVAGAELARLDVQGNNWASSEDCYRKLGREAGALGANAVAVQLEPSGMGQGPHCSGVAYRRTTIVASTAIPDAGAAD